MNEYTLTSISALGDNHPTYGQTYWGEVMESNKPVMFNSKADHVSPDAKITAEEQEPATSKKGNDYLKLRKVKVHNPQGSTPGGGQLDRIEAKLDRLLKSIGEEDPEDRGDDSGRFEGERDEPPEDEPVDLSDIPF